MVLKAHKCLLSGSKRNVDTLVMFAEVYIQTYACSCVYMYIHSLKVHSDTVRVMKACVCH